MKRILLLTDFSESASKAIEFALRFWSGVRCKFYLFHIQDTSNYTSDDIMSQASHQTIYDSLVKTEKLKLAKLEQRLKKIYSHEPFSFISIVDVDTYIDGVNQAVKLHNINLVVLGSNGVSNVKEILFGTHALMTMRSVKCDILVVPTNYTPQSSDTLLFILDEKDRLDLLILDRLEAFRTQGGWKLEVLRFFENKIHPKILEADQSILKSDITYTPIEGLSLSHAVDILVQTNKIGLLAMVGNFKSVLSRFLSKGQKTEIAMLGKLPLLSLKN